jgi:tetratricopeptide (TPR) repeat protein
VERGDLAGARRALDAAQGFNPRSHGADFWRGSRAELLLGEGRLEEALEACNEYCEHLDPRANPSPHPWRSFRAEILDRLGRTGEALELAREEVEVARRWGAPGATGRALRRLGEIEREDGIERLREAVDVLEGSVSRLQLAKALCSLGHGLRLARRPTRRLASRSAVRSSSPRSAAPSRSCSGPAPICTPPGRARAARRSPAPAR